MWGVTDPKLWMNLLSDPGLRLFSFLYRSTSWTCTFSPSLRSGCLIFPSTTFLWEKLAGFIFCYFSVLFFFIISVLFLLSYFFLSTKLWMHLLSFGCSLGSHSRGFYFSCRCLHALSSISTFCGPVCFFTRHVCLPAGWRWSCSTAVWPPNLRLPTYEQYFPLYFIFFFFIMWGRFWRSCSSCAS